MTECDFETNRVKDLPATEAPGRGRRAAVAVRAWPAHRFAESEHYARSRYDPSISRHPYVTASTQASARI